MSGVDPIRVLHVDDDPGLGEVVESHLERENDRLTVTTATSARAGLDLLAEESFDCVVSDYDMPETTGLELLRTVRADYPDLPFILFTGKGSEEIASEAISAGVTEYLQKTTGTDQYAVLANRIERAVSERRARAALEEEERMRSTLIANLPGMVYRCRNERGWPMTFVSEGAASLTGYDAEAIESGAVDWESDVIVADDRDRMWEAVQSALAEGEPFEVTYRIETADGERRWMWERGRAVDEHDEIIEGFITDITERKRRKRDLREEREVITTLVDALQDIFYVIDPGGTLLRWNDRLSEITGYDDGTIAEMDAIDFFVEDHREEAIESTREIIRTGSATFEADLETADGERVPIEFRGTAIEGEDGTVEKVCGVGRDVSERKQRERELERYETVLEAIGDPVYTLDENGVVTFVNDALESLTGYDSDRLVGTHVSEIMVEEDVERGQELIADLLDGEGTATTFEMDLVTADGTHVPCESHVCLLPSDDGEFRGTAGVIRDISDRKERERRLEEFASVVSHDLKSPLTVVQGRTELVRETGDLSHLAEVSEAADRMERLIDDLLTLAREGETVGDREPVAVSVAARRAWEQVPTGEATLELTTDRTVNADFERLRELFENLFRNAIEHGVTATSGTREANGRTASTEDPVESTEGNAPGLGPEESKAGNSSGTGPADLTVRVSDTETGFAVSDDGVGIPPEKRDDVFDHGFTTDDDGTGFGLSIVEGIATAHGWRVSLGESDGGGARFEFHVSEDERP